MPLWYDACKGLWQEGIMKTPFFDGKLVHSRRVIYTPSPFARSNLIHLQEVGSLQARQPHTSTRKGLASYLFFWVESGSGVLEYEGARHELHAGDCVFLDCQRPYQHHTGDDLWQLHWVHFYGPNMAAIYKKYQERGGLPCFRAADPGGYAALLDELYALAESDTYVRDMQIYEKLIALLTLLMEESWHPDTARAPGSKKQNLQEIKDYLDTHYTEKITLDALAERFYINKFYLTRVFKEQFGQSVTNYLVQLRITQSKRLLRFTDRSIEAVAQECGLNDANYFSRLFKKVEGTTPGEYRRQW